MKFLLTIAMLLSVTSLFASATCKVDGACDSEAACKAESAEATYKDKYCYPNKQAEVDCTAINDTSLTKGSTSKPADSATGTTGAAVSK